MILSQTAIYALQAVMHLAEAGPGEPHRVGDIAEALGVPRNYLAKILNGLARSGVLTSTRGPGGRARCSDIAPCAAHARWKVVSTAVKAYLLETTIQDMTASCGAVPKPVGPTP